MIFHKTGVSFCEVYDHKSRMISCLVFLMQNKTTRTHGNGKNITLFVFKKKLIYSFNSRRLAPLSPSPKHYNVHPYRVAPFQHTPTPIVTHAPQRSTFVWNIVKILRYYVKLQENVKNWQFSEIFLQNVSS